MISSRRLLVGVTVVAIVASGCSPDDATGCVATPVHPEWSIARMWNEATLDAIRRDLPAPTVHARNLYHVSAAMWDAWAAFDVDAIGLFVDEKLDADDPDEARAEAMSYAAYRVLDHRYLNSIGATETIPELDALMESLCYDIAFETVEGGSPAALGNRIADVVISSTMSDGSNEANGYDADPPYEPVNEPLVVREAGTEMVDPNRWQPLEIENMVSQNGILLDSGVQEFIDPHWGFVESFAMDPAPGTGMPIDPGVPPHLGDPDTDQKFKADAVAIVAYSSLLDPEGSRVIDIGPGSMGNNPIGTHENPGRALNPVTGAAYGQNLVSEADFGRVVAEFWADGPNSETPPGHWNTMANAASDQFGGALHIRGEGDLVDRLEWDVKLYLALNGANHDAAVAAWGSKGFYDYVRPISMIRYMGGLGQSTDPTGPSYDPNGLPLVEGLVAVITEESAAPGGPHEHLADHVGEVAVRAYAGTPVDREVDVGGVDWIRAVEWAPYQSPTFVTPSFGAYVSGHSSFSRASAEVLTAFTGSEFFPGGLGEWTIEEGSLDFEYGPTQDVVLQWATYRDAADQAGISRLHGGIHVEADDFGGRLMGQEIGQRAWARASELYGR